MILTLHGTYSQVMKFLKENKLSYLLPKEDKILIQLENTNDESLIISIPLEEDKSNHFSLGDKTQYKKATKLFKTFKIKQDEKQQKSKLSKSQNREKNDWKLNRTSKWKERDNLDRWED